MMNSYFRIIQLGETRSKPSLLNVLFRPGLHASLNFHCLYELRGLSLLFNELVYFALIPKILWSIFSVNGLEDIFIAVRDPARLQPPLYNANACISPKPIVWIECNKYNPIVYLTGRQRPRVFCTFSCFANYVKHFYTAHYSTSDLTIFLQVHSYYLLTIRTSQALVVITLFSSLWFHWVIIRNFSLIVFLLELPTRKYDPVSVIK